MPTYTIVAGDKDPLDPGEIRAGETIEVAEGDVFIVDPSADENIRFAPASGSPTAFEVRFDESNFNSIDMQFDGGLNPSIAIADDVDLSRVKLDAKDADSVNLTAGDNVTLEEYEGSDEGVDVLTIGDDFTLDKDLKTGDGDDVIDIGDRATLDKIEAKGGDNTISVGDDSNVAKIETKNGDDQITIGDGAEVDQIKTGDGDDLIRVGADASIDKIDGGGGFDTLLTQSDPDDIDIKKVESIQVVCFAAGTLIATGSGDVPVEDLKVGDMVTTLDHGEQPVRWIGSRALGSDELAAKPRLKPIRISAGALGGGLPLRDLTVSPQHRVLVRSRIAARMFDVSEVLVPANKLTDLDGIAVVEDAAAITYVHLLLDRHEILLSEGAATESLYPGPQALSGQTPEAREEILELFPELADPQTAPLPARPIPARGRDTKSLSRRHAKNRKPLVEEVVWAPSSSFLDGVPVCSRKSIAAEENLDVSRIPDLRHLPGLRGCRCKPPARRRLVVGACGLCRDG